MTLILDSSEAAITMGAMGPMARALDLYRRGRMREAQALCEHLLLSAGARADVLTLLSEIQLATGQVEAAVGHLTTLVDLQPTDAASHRRLGGALMSLGKTADAIVAFSRAVELEPDNVRGHNNLGQALLQSGQTSEAVRHFERSLALSPSYAIGYHNLALALEKMDRFPEALDGYERTLRLAPEIADAWAARGALLAKLNRAAAALESFDEALKRRPDDAKVLLRKAAALLVLERTVDAIAVADEALERQPDLVEALNVKAGALSRLHRPAEALVCLTRALELDPSYVEGWCSRAIVHHQLSDTDAATLCHRRALLLDPDCIEARTGLIAGLIPAVPLTTAESVHARNALKSELAGLEQWLQGRNLSQEDRWMLAKQPFFYLSYQDECNKPLLRRYRQESAGLLASRTFGVPPRATAGKLADAPRRLRLGIVSAHVFDHSVWNAIVKGWIERLDGGKFEKAVFSIGTCRDATTQAAEHAVDHVDAKPKTLGEWADAIARHRLDALIYPEIGMDRTTLALANLRLCERQFAAWGHPETSGLPTIDHYLSAESFEPADADDHYSETLVRLPNLGVYYRPYALEPATVDLAQLGIPSDRPVFICPGTPFKYRPEHDWILVEIARRIGACTFVFFDHDRIEFSRKLLERIASAFAQSGLDARQYLKRIVWLPRPDFVGLLRQADVYLDTIGFSGFNTFMQAVQAHLPAVAHQSRFMRGRLGSGILTRLGLSELVAHTAQGYIEIAVKLATDHGYRTRIRTRMASAEHSIYADDTTIDALSSVLLCDTI